MSGARARGLPVVLCLLAAGCEAGPRTVWWDGEYLRYLSSTDLQPCAGTGPLADAFVPFVAGELGLELPSKIDYHWLNPEDFAQSDCPDHSGGCAFGAETYGRRSLIRHESVHSIAAANEMHGLPFFNEGLATAYDIVGAYVADFRYERDFSRNRGDPRPEMTLPARDLNYWTASNFVSFLLARHGPEKLVEISRRTENGDGLDTIRSKFRAVYELELDDEAELYMRSDDLACDDDHFDVLPQDCTMPEVAWSGERWTYAGVMSCDDEDVAGGYRETMNRSVTVDVPETGQYLLRAFGDGQYVVVGRCFGCPWQHRDVLLFPGVTGETEARLEAGRHFVRMEAVAGQTPIVGVTITPAP